ncbi:choloylglycine hydrolase [Mycolicibacterium sp. BK556]|uniref:linear amide C-N hydrolase n=1 Tax=Mycobacteriaceae TaxID=1762 RepID=UPI00105DF5CF|nr:MULTISPECIES: linear amide C-N hydrolase [Mycobacteriaceae]MBB3602142.1 choloylglycine hydrolase [Mycolicibacterium sp. BK556]MBB3631894.1 choloylglycine hydrolase [Mycolicibacterium sp. BK607]MBB3749913.1 choloylglycine hydrolase [Mycolicibacterium sp. BK634]TDO18814.1 choloylglycine hydrolase [Mycobacterium sp. BK086]
MCTRVLWNTNDLAVLTGRSMDWPESTQPLIVGFPRGRERDGSHPAGLVSDPNPLRWTGTHASLVTTVYGLGTVDGINEVGLAGHALYLNETDFGPRDPAKPGVHAGLWLQYLLDQAGTVAEALALMDTIQVFSVSAHGRDANLHLALEDVGGDSAIIEFANGKPVVHHGRQFTLMTNDPTYDEQLKLLSLQDFSHPSRDMPLPGNVNPVDRFQRAAYYSALLPKPGSQREAIASVMAIMRNVSVPFGAPYGDFGVYNTEYRTVTDLTNRMYFFELTTSPNVIWVDMDRLKLDGEPVAVNPYDESLVGDVTDRFAPHALLF